MTTPVSLPAEVSATAGAGATAPPAAIDPRETKVFAALMAPGGAQSGSAGTAVSSAATALAAQLRDLRSVDEIRRSMLESLDPSDPVLSMWQLTDASVEMQATFQKMHLAAGLASAATGMVGLLLKNQQ
jgi:hypothetical protein